MLANRVVLSTPMSFSTAVLNLAYFALVSATFTRTIVVLRAFLIASGISFFVYGVMVENWSTFGWNIVIITLHLRQLVLYIRSQRRVELTNEERTAQQRYFPDLTDFDFVSLWSMGETVERRDMVLIEENEQHGQVALILDGTVEVTRAGYESVSLGAGALIGEMSFVSGQTANARTRAVGAVRLRKWPQERLKTLDVLNPAAAKALERFIQRDLVAKLA